MVQIARNSQSEFGCDLHGWREVFTMLLIHSARVWWHATAAFVAFLRSPSVRLMKMPLASGLGFGEGLFFASDFDLDTVNS
jgi:hypothetical protein